MNEIKVKRSASKIKATLAEHGYFTLKAAALAIHVDPDYVSQAINYLRELPEVRLALANLVDMEVGQLFDESIECVPARFREKVA